MKSRKIILSAAALGVTVGSALGFKLTHKFNVHSLYVKVTAGGKCLMCTDLFFAISGICNKKCHTIGPLHHTVAGTLSNHCGFYTAQTAGGFKCTAKHLTTKSTVVN